jgi:hypothetical protein
MAKLWNTLKKATRGKALATVVAVAVLVALALVLMRMLWGPKHVKRWHKKDEKKKDTDKKKKKEESANAPETVKGLRKRSTVKTADGKVHRVRIENRDGLAWLVDKDTGKTVGDSIGKADKKYAKGNLADISSYYGTPIQAANIKDLAKPGGASLKELQKAADKAIFDEATARAKGHLRPGITDYKLYLDAAKYDAKHKGEQIEYKARVESSQGKGDWHCENGYTDTGRTYDNSPDNSEWNTGKATQQCRKN